MYSQNQQQQQMQALEGAPVGLMVCILCTVLSIAGFFLYMFLCVPAKLLTDELLATDPSCYNAIHWAYWLYWISLLTLVLFGCAHVYCHSENMHKALIVLHVLFGLVQCVVAVWVCYEVTWSKDVPRSWVRTWFLVYEWLTAVGFCCGTCQQSQQLKGGAGQQPNYGQFGNAV